MDCAPNVNIFRELQTVHDTGYFSGHVSPEEDWQQVRKGGRETGGLSFPTHAHQHDRAMLEMSI